MASLDLALLTPLLPREPGCLGAGRPEGMSACVSVREGMSKAVCVGAYERV